MCVCVLIHSSLVQQGTPFTGTMGDVYAPPGEAIDPSKLIVLTIVDPFWVCGVHGNILKSIVSNSHF